MSRIYEPQGMNPFEQETHPRRTSYNASLNPFEDDNNKSPQVRTSQPENRVLKTVALYLSFFALGFTHNSIGPTLVQMELFLGTDTKTLSWVFTAFSVGYIVGSVLCGILFDRLNAELTIMVSGVGVGLSFTLGPFIGGLYGYIAFMFACGLFSGFIDAGGQGYTVGLWEGTRWKEPSLQGAHMAWSVGGALGPLVVRPFLSNIQLATADSHGCIYNTNSTATGLVTEITHNPTPIMEVVISNISQTAMHPGYTFSGMDAKNSSEPSQITQEYGSVRFAYLTLGLVSLVAPVFFAVLFVCNGPSFRRKSSEKPTKREEAEDNRSHQSKCFVLTMLILMFVFYMFYLVLEVSPGNFLASFTIKELCWENHQGAMIASVLWAAHGVGRLIGVPLSMFVSPKLMLIVDLTLQVLAYSLMCFVHFHTAIMWLSAALLGLGMSTTFATGILWVSEFIKINGFSSAILMIGSSTGSITSPIFVGYMFDQFSPMWLIYIGLTAAILQCISFIAADIFARRKFVRKPRPSGAEVGGATEYKAAEMEPLKIDKHHNF